MISSYNIVTKNFPDKDDLSLNNVINNFWLYEQRLSLESEKRGGKEPLNLQLVYTHNINVKSKIKNPEVLGDKDK